ncbi:unnamed protein product [Notodromas monacha]|uniref:Reelin domain-containing protein n=1 Tax=Notodromas monacha TaxID=399045 RepID=A0A7R9BW33_9CRUS|nr:unnamed protein product [Notodromas monacha]CAG0921479.1 unnamed protein product [Notodromas monacha]
MGYERKKLLATLLATLAILTAPVSPYSMGAPPAAACGDGVPRHGPSPQKSPAPFRISVNADEVDSGNSLSVQLAAADDGEPFIGFLLQAKNSTNGVLSGQFLRENDNDVYLFLNCDELEGLQTTTKRVA